MSVENNENNENIDAPKMPEISVRALNWDDMDETFDVYMEAEGSGEQIVALFGAVACNLIMCGIPPIALSSALDKAISQAKDRQDESAKEDV